MEPNRPIFDQNDITQTPDQSSEVEEEEEYDEEEDNGPVQVGKSRSFIVTIDEHNPKKLNSILQKKMRQGSSGD